MVGTEVVEAGAGVDRFGSVVDVVDTDDELGSVVLVEVVDEGTVDVGGGVLVAQAFWAWARAADADAESASAVFWALTTACCACFRVGVPPEVGFFRRRRAASWWSGRQRPGRTASRSPRCPPPSTPPKDDPEDDDPEDDASSASFSVSCACAAASVVWARLTFCCSVVVARWPASGPP